MNLKTFTHNKRFFLENGGSLANLEIAYHTFGKLNPEKSNVIWVAHALTANSNVFDWWKGLFGENDLFNPEEFFIICANNPGSCYGSTGPLSINSDTKTQWFDYFPDITIRDIAQSFELLRTHLGITKIHTLIGGSQGGQIALEWSLLNSSLADHLILIATNARHSPWGIAFNESQRLAIKADRTYYSNTTEGGKKGLAAARSIALLSYRNYDTYAETQQDDAPGKIQDFSAATYQRYQGEKLVNRFNAYSYVRLLNAMDSHNISRGRTESCEDVLKRISAKTLVISITSDLLFPPQEQKLLAYHIPRSEYAKINSDFGHDGFLIETKKLADRIRIFYKEEKTTREKDFLQNLLFTI